MKKLILLVILTILTGSVKAAEVRLYCNWAPSLSIDFILNRKIKANNEMSVWNYRTGYSSFTYLKETAFKCFKNEVCFVGNDFYYFYHIKIPDHVFRTGTSRSLVFIEARSRGYYPNESFFIGCNSWR